MEKNIIDVREESCPNNFVKIKLKLEMMENGQILQVFLNDGDSMRNVPKSIKAEGHKIIKVEKFEKGFKIYIKVINN